MKTLVTIIAGLVLASCLNIYAWRFANYQLGMIPGYYQIAKLLITLETEPRR